VVLACERAAECCAPPFRLSHRMSPRIVLCKWRDSRRQFPESDERIKTDATIMSVLGGQDQQKTKSTPVVA
jgi:hypothetical protein